MKVLLDENLDHALRKLLGQHDVVTVTFMGWAGLKNGELLRAAEDGGIEVLVTGDQTLHHYHQEQPAADHCRDRQCRARLVSGSPMRNLQPKTTD